MKKMLLVLSLAVFIFPATLSFSQEEMINLNSKAFIKHKRPVVVFPHLMHEDKIDCSRCHHDYDKYGVNIDEDGKSCSECHNVPAKDNPVSLANAFHRKCKGCHESINAKEKTNLPIMCGQCHKKNE